MIAGGSQTLLCAVLLWGGATSAEAASPLALTNVEKSGEDFVELAQRHEAAYVEIYPPDFLPLDTQHRIVEAFNFPEPPGLASAASLPAGFVGFRPWLKQRNRVLYLREGTVTQRFVREGPPVSVARFAVRASTPERHSPPVGFNRRSFLGASAVAGVAASPANETSAGQSPAPPPKPG